MKRLRAADAHRNLPEGHLDWFPYYYENQRCTKHALAEFEIANAA